MAHPGIAVTNITAHYPPIIYKLIKYPMKVIFMSPKKACLPILAALLEGCRTNEWIGPRLFNVWGLPRWQILKTASPAEQAKIVEIVGKLDLG